MSTLRKDVTFRNIGNKGSNTNSNDDIIYGYIRMNYNGSESKIFPIDIIKIIIFFYQDGLTWKFTDDQLKLFKTAKHSDSIQSIDININDIDAIFNYVLYPNSSRYSVQNDWRQFKGWINFGLQMIKMPENIEYIEIYFELKCIETDNCYKTSHIFGIYQPTNIVKVSLAKLTECKYYKQLTFIGCMDVLCIKYKKNMRLNNDPRYMNLTKMRKYCQFEWEIKKNLILNKFETNPRIYSTNFNFNVFTLYLAKKDGLEALFAGYNHKNNQKINPLIIGIKMLRIPEKIKKLDIEYNIGINKKKYKRYAIIKCGWDKIFNLSKDYQIRSQIKDINITINIKIIKIFDYNDQEIQSIKWKQYNIV